MIYLTFSQSVKFSTFYSAYIIFTINQNFRYGKYQKFVVFSVEKLFFNLNRKIFQIKYHHCPIHSKIITNHSFAQNLKLAKFTDLLYLILIYSKLFYLWNAPFYRLKCKINLKLLIIVPDGGQRLYKTTILFKPLWFVCSFV